MFSSIFRELIISYRRKREDKIPQSVRMILKPFNKIFKLLIFFIILSLFFWYSLPILPKFSFWSILLFLALAWFLIEVKINWMKRKRIKKAVMIGLFLMIFDFIFENSGFYIGFWTSFHSLFFVLTVPVEIIGVTLLGGIAWALYLPRKFNRLYSVADILLFSIFGTLGELILTTNGIMSYSSGWTSLHAFFSYMITWIILHTLNYKISK